MRGKRI